MSDSQSLQDREVVTTVTAPSPTRSEATVKLLAALRAQVAACKVDLPLLPGVAIKILSMTADAKADAARLAAVIHSDQALAGHVLRIVNSAYFGSVSPIVSLRQAVARIGFETLATVVTAAAARNTVYTVPGFSAEVAQLWRHALLSGLSAREIARVKNADLETAFLCGLLHNIGKPVVLKAAVDLNKKLNLKVGKPEIVGLMDELQGHTGALLAVKWALPRPVLESIIWTSSRKGEALFATEARITSLADRMATHVLEPEKTTAADVKADPGAKGLQLSAEDLDGLLGQRERLLGITESLAL